MEKFQEKETAEEICCQLKFRNFPGNALIAGTL